MNGFLNKIYTIIGDEYKHRSVLILAGMLLIAFFEVISIAIVLPFMKLALDIHASSESAYVTKIKAFFSLGDNQIIIVFGLAVIGLYIVKNILHFFINKFQLTELHKIRASVSRKIFSMYIHMDYSDFIEKNTASLIHNSTGQVANFVLVFLQSLLFILSELIVIIAIAILLFIVNPKIMIILCSILCFVGFFMIAFFKRKLKKVGEEQNLATIKMYKTISEGIGALKEIKILQVENYFIELFDSYSKKYQEMAVLVSKLQVVPKLIFEVIFISGLIGVVVVAEFLKLNLIEIIPTLIVFAMAFFKLFPSVNKVISLNNSMIASRISFDTLHDELKNTSDGEPVIKKTEISKSSSQFKDKITFENVSFSYGGSKKVFTNFSLNIPKYSTVAFVGRSGAGKTTLIDMILGLITPESGRVLFDDLDISQNVSFWHQKISYIPQTIAFIDDTIKNNIALGIHDVDENKLSKCVADAQLKEFVSTLPEGIETIIGDKGVKLSGGQRQRIGIARALYKNPDILIFDEATSALDVETERALTESIKSLGRSKTVIIVAHRISTIKNSDTIIVLENGKVKDSGTFDELLRTNKWFQDINE